MDRSTTPETVEELFRRHAPELRRHAAGLLRAGGVEPDDVLQEVMVRIIARHGTDPIVLEHPRAWLHACVRNASLSHLRGERPAVALDEAVTLPQPASEPSELLVTRDETRAVLADLARLEERQRGALLATALGATSYAGVAREMGASEASVSALVARARGNLKALRRARHMPCDDVRALVDRAADRRTRSSELVRRHLALCSGCRVYADGRRSRRAGRGRLAGWLAPVQGLVAHLGSRAAELVVPAGVESQVAHGIAVLLVTFAATSPPDTPTAGPESALASVVRAGTTPVDRPSREQADAPAGARREASRPDRGVPRAARSPLVMRVGGRPRTEQEQARPAELNLFGCPKIRGRATTEDAACRRANRGAVRAQIDARLARHAAAREAAARQTAPAPADAAPAAPPVETTAAATSTPAPTTEASAPPFGSVAPPSDSGAGPVAGVPVPRPGTAGPDYDSASSPRDRSTGVTPSPTR